MTTLARYILFQVPGWLIAAAVIAWLWPATGASGWLALLVFGAWVLKDFALYPLLRGAYRSEALVGASALVGMPAVVRAELDPCGYVEVRGELWQATAPPADAPVLVGERVRITSAVGLALSVVRDAESG